MIAPDANLLIFAHDPVSPFHDPSRRWLEDILSEYQPIGFPILCIHGFLRFVTNPQIASTPVTFQQGADIVGSWLALPHVRILYPGERHWQILRQLSHEVRLRGNLITDAAIAAIAQEYGATIYSNDRDFARFPGLRWINPLNPPNPLET